MSEVDNIIDTLLNLSITPSTDSASPNREVPTNNNYCKLLKHIIKNNRKSTMAQFKPEYLSCIPQFDGNPNDLNRYLAVCQSIINSFYIEADPNNFQNVYLLNCLIGKLTGNAKLVLGIQTINTWNDVKDVLQRNFADQRDEACLNRDLVMLKQASTENPNQFYDRILHILNLLCAYVDSHENTDAAKLLKKNLYNNLALTTFLSGLKEPLGTTIRCMRPTNLATALQYVTQESNNHYFQSLNKQNIQKTHSQNFRPNYNFNTANTPQIRPNFNSFNSQTAHNQFSAKPAFPSQPVPIRPNWNNRPQRFFTNSQVFRNPNQPNVFRPNQNKPLPKPTPMSVSTRQFSNNFRQNPQNTFNNNYQQRNFVSEELYNTETDQIPNDQIDNQYTQYYPTQYDETTNNDFETEYPVEYDTDHTQSYSYDQGQSSLTHENENFRETPTQNSNT